MYPYAVYDPQANATVGPWFRSRPTGSWRLVGIDVFRFDDLLPAMPASEAVYQGFEICQTEDEAYAYWQREHAILCDRNGISPSGKAR